MNVNEVLQFEPSATEQGRRKTVTIRIGYNGGVAEKNAIHAYDFQFMGEGVDPETGDIDCLGPAGSSEANQFILTFEVSCDGSLDNAQFLKPGTSNDFVFNAGRGVCGETPDETELKEPKLLPNGNVMVRNKKKNSEHPLGYSFIVWITHLDGQVRGVPRDPRIINV